MIQRNRFYFSKQKGASNPKGGSKQEGGSSIRSISLGISFFTLFLLLLIIPAAVQIQPSQSSDIDVLELISLSNDTLSALNPCVRKSLIPLHECIFLSISLTLTIVCVLAALITERKSTKTHLSSTPRNKKIQSNEDDCKKTNGRKISTHPSASNKGPQKHEEEGIPLISPKTDGANQPRNTTNETFGFPLLGAASPPPEKRSTLSI